MTRNYRRGLAIIAAVLVISAGLHSAWALFGPRGMPTRAAQDLSAAPLGLGEFRLVERSGRTITQDDLADRVWIASFVFTRCPSSCPRIASTLRSLQGQLDGTNVRLVCLSVDPEHDRPEVLAKYADTYGADPERWWFLTGDRTEIHDLIRRRFKLAVASATEEEQAQGSEAVIHSDRLALVDRGNRVVGFFSSADAEKVTELLAKARELSGPTPPDWARILPKVNAGLNSLCAVLLIVGLLLIRSGRRTAHITCMIVATLVSTLFLGCYLVYHAQVGSVPFTGVGAIRSVYYIILLSHTTLAAGMVPLVLLTLWRGLKGRYEAHAKVSSLTYPIWLYVSITGVIIYLLLYQWPHSVPVVPA